MSLVAANFQPIKGSTEKSAGEPAGPKTSNAGRKERPQPAVAKDPDAIRTLIISNLPPDGLTNASLWKKIRKYTGAEKVQWPLGEDSSKGIVIYCTINENSNNSTYVYSKLWQCSILRQMQPRLNPAYTHTSTKARLSQSSSKSGRTRYSDNEARIPPRLQRTI